MFDEVLSNPLRQIDRDRETVAAVVAVGLAIAVFIPMTRPWRSTSGPPEFPGLIAASRLDEVLEGRRGLVIPIQDPDLATLRVTIPAVAVAPRRNG